MVSHHLWCLFPLTGAEKAWKQLRGAQGGCVWEVLTNSSRNRALLQSFPPMSVNFDASRFLVRLGKKCFTYKCLCIRGGGCKTSHHWFTVSQPFSPAVLAGSVLAHVPWLCCPTFGWTPAAETYQAANRYITHRLKPFCLPSSSLQRQLLGQPARLLCSGPLLKEDLKVMAPSPKLPGPSFPPAPFSPR